MSHVGGGSYTGTGDKPDLNNHSNQCNPNNPEYKGHQPGYQGTGDKPDLENHSRQKNPEDVRYQQSRQK